jgi:hypothetical protein
VLRDFCELNPRLEPAFAGLQPPHFSWLSLQVADLLVIELHRARHWNPKSLAVT